MSRPKIIAFYLPQFHPTPDNDKWWGKGFTEWTNVAKAKPLFRGHYQPHIPADLGFYDLRLPEVREAQAELAREAGVDGFCYWSYWFGNGKVELELPFNEVLRLGKPDFPFMLCWANESWHSKFWNKNGTIEKKVLVEQLYPGKEDYINHFYYRLPAFKDSRYMKIDNKPIFMIYRWKEIHNIKEFIEVWQALAIKEGFNGMYFIAHEVEEPNYETYKRIKALGFDAMNTVRIWDAEHRKISRIKYIFRWLKMKMTGIPRLREYSDIFKFYFTKDDGEEEIFPTLIPNWDHSPRSGTAGVIINNSHPNYFKLHVDNVLNGVKNKIGPNLVFIRAWNEWGEGNHMEPDLRYGKG